MTPRRIAMLTACARSEAPSLVSNCSMCDFTVDTETSSRDAIAAFVEPSAINSSTRHSRVENSTPPTEREADWSPCNHAVTASG